MNILFIFLVLSGLTVFQVPRPRPIAHNQGSTEFSEDYTTTSATRQREIFRGGNTITHDRREPVGVEGEDGAEGPTSRDVVCYLLESTSLSY